MRISIDTLRLLVVIFCAFASGTVTAQDQYRIVLDSFDELSLAEKALVQLRTKSDIPLQVSTVEFEGRDRFWLTTQTLYNVPTARRVLPDVRRHSPDARLEPVVDVYFSAGQPGVTNAPAVARIRLIDTTVISSLEPSTGKSARILDTTVINSRDLLTQEQSAAVVQAPVQTAPSTPIKSRKVVVDSREKKPKRKSSYVPPGFEDLLQPQTTEIDVYFGGAFLTATLATYTPMEITLLDPESVVSEMNDLLNPQSIVSLLSEPMPSNAELVCLYANQTGCGELQTDSLEVIFDENRFRMDLFIGPSLLAVRDVGIDKFLPASSGGLAFLNQFNATVNGREGESSTYNIGNSTTIAFKETRLLALSNVTREEDFTIDTLALEREFTGRLYQAGYFRSSAANLVFITEQEFAGITVSSSLDTRTDLDQSTGNDLQVFLDSRSRVDILKDGRLISTAVYDAGNQIVDTSSLPGGAFDIVLRIRDSFGRTRQETRFYVKTTKLPPVDHTLYFLNIGETAFRKEDQTLPETTGNSLVRAGISRRLTSNFGGNIGILSQENEALYEIGVFRLGRSYELNLNFASGNAGDRGASFNARFRHGPLTLNANLRKTWIDDDRTDISLFRTRTTQGSLNLTVPIGRGTLNVTGRYNKRGNEDADKNFGIRFNLPVRNSGRMSLDSDIQLTEDNDEFQALLTLRLRFDRNNWRDEIVSQYYYDEFAGQDDEDGFINNLATSWQDGNRFRSDVNWNLRATSERDDDTIETDGEVVSDYGRMTADLLYSEKSEQLSWGASLHTNLIANRGTISFGGREQARSALVMDVKGDVKDAYFDVLVNNAPRASARIGSKTVIGLQPYKTYDVSLIQKGDSIVDFNNQVQSTTLYPGNVVTMEWKASRIVIAFGQLLRDDGEPVKNALISGVTGIATTDEFGFFQAEIETDTTLIRARTRTDDCETRLPELVADETVAMLGELICR